jgi:quercetin dioxygenase-like cupin family protein
MSEIAVPAYTKIDNLADLLGTIQPDSIISRTIYKGKELKAVLFGFDQGQELSEHTSSHEAIIQVIRGRATVTLGGDSHELEAGGWVHMAPRLQHTVHAQTPLIMLLLMLSAN